MLHAIQVEAMGAYRYRIPRDPQRGMRTDAVVYANRELMQHIQTDLSLEQAVNVATLPGIVRTNLERLTAEMLPDNTAVMRICEKLGFSLTPSLEDEVVRAEFKL